MDKWTAERRTSNVERRTSNENSDEDSWENAVEYKKYDLEERLLNYAVMVIEVVERLPKTKAGNHVGGQLVRSGTSPLSNHGEAQAAESRRDFLHKMRICLKELRESSRWLALIRRARSLKLGSELEPALQETDELIRIFVKSIQTTESRD